MARNSRFMVSMGGVIEVDEAQGRIRAHNPGVSPGEWLKYDRLTSRYGGHPVPGQPWTALTQDGWLIEAGTLIGTVESVAGPWRVVRFPGHPRPVVSDGEGFLRPSVDGTEPMLALALNAACGLPGATPWTVTEPAPGGVAIEALDPFAQRELVFGTICAVRRAADLLGRLPSPFADGVAHVLDGAQGWDFGLIPSGAV